MELHPDLESPDYFTAKIESFETDQSASTLDPAYQAPSHYLFTGLNEDQLGKAELQIHVGEFKEGGYNGIPPEALLLALRDHYAGLNNSSIACREITMVVGLLDDAVQSLKGVNDRRHYKGILGTILPE